MFFSKFYYNLSNHWFHHRAYQTGLHSLLLATNLLNMYVHVEQALCSANIWCKHRSHCTADQLKHVEMWNLSTDKPIFCLKKQKQAKLTRYCLLCYKHQTVFEKLTNYIVKCSVPCGTFGWIDTVFEQKLVVHHGNETLSLCSHSGQHWTSL